MEDNTYGPTQQQIEVFARINKTLAEKKNGKMEVVTPTPQLIPDQKKSYVRNAIFRWCFTASCDKITLDDLKALLKRYCKKWVFQQEKGKETEFLHYQGRLSLKVKSRTTSEMFPFHCSPEADNESSDFYCTKEDTRVDGPWTDHDTYIPKDVREIKDLYPWQQQVVDSAKNFDDRKVDVVYDTEGRIGKSFLRKYVECKGIGVFAPVMSGPRDVARMVMNCAKADGGFKPLYIFDMPRGIHLNKTAEANFYAAVEEIKNGYAYDDRYEFKRAFFDPPRVWVFTNQLPDLNLLSKDRWNIWRPDPADRKKIIPYKEYDLTPVGTEPQQIPLILNVIPKKIDNTVPILPTGVPYIPTPTIGGRKVMV